MHTQHSQSYSLSVLRNVCI